MKLWFETDISVFMDISTYCNAGCPQCHRTNSQGLGKEDWLPLVKWSLADFVKAFPVEVLDNIKKFSFCGTWGDPMMAKDILKIVDYIINNSFNPSIVITTNGSLRSEDFWWNLGVLAKRRLEVIFDVDGTTQEMHEKYRRFTNLDMVLANMKTLSQTPARVKSQTVLFKHNQDYKDEIHALATDHGSGSHSFVISDRFKSNETQNHHTDENGKEFVLEEADRAVLDNPTITGTSSTTLTDKIVCRWASPRNEIVVNPDGQILPCCYHQNNYYRALNDPGYNSEFLETPEYIEYLSNKEKYNIFHTPLSEIINSKWYSETLPNSMSGSNPVTTCERNCSTRVIKTHQLRETK